MSDESYQFWSELEKWSEQTFGPKSLRGPIGPLKHLAKEVVETLNEPDNLEEYADCIFLIYDACQRAGFEYHELIATLTDKLKKNKKRQWPDWRTADLNKPIEHIRNEDQSKFTFENGNEE
jgi:hypothetical protein